MYDTLFFVDNQYMLDDIISSKKTMYIIAYNVSDMCIIAHS